jgi:hypothetical protein
MTLVVTQAGGGGGGGGNMYFNHTFGGVNVSNNRFLDACGVSESLGDTFRLGTPCLFNAKLVFVGIKIDSFAPGIQIEIQDQAAVVKTTITILADDQITDLTGSAITFNSGDAIRVMASAGFVSSEDLQVVLLLEST